VLCRRPLSCCRLSVYSGRRLLCRRVRLAWEAGRACRLCRRPATPRASASLAAARGARPRGGAEACVVARVESRLRVLCGGARGVVGCGESVPAARGRVGGGEGGSAGVCEFVGLTPSRRLVIIYELSHHVNYYACRGGAGLGRAAVWRSLGRRGGPRGCPCGGEMGSHGPPKAPIFSGFFGDFLLVFMGHGTWEFSAVSCGHCCHAPLATSFRCC